MKKVKECLDKYNQQINNVLMEIEEEMAYEYNGNKGYFSDVGEELNSLHKKIEDARDKINEPYYRVNWDNDDIEFYCGGYWVE